MRSLPFILVVFAGLCPLRAQLRLDGEREALANSYFDKFPQSTVSCDAELAKPRLDYGFRFFVSYGTEFRMRDFTGQENAVAVFLRVTPRGGEPVVLGTWGGLPDIEDPGKGWLRSEGAFLLGQGIYDVDWLLVDRFGRACRKHWKTEARLRRGESEVDVALSPGTVEQITMRPWQAGQDGPARPDGSRLTVLLHAASANPRAVRLSAFDRGMLLASLSSVLRMTSFRQVRVVAFNLDQQKILFEDDHLESGDFSRLGASLEKLRLGTVPLAVLANPRGREDLLADLVNRETGREASPDAVVFLGWPARYYSKFPRERLESTAPGPRFFHIEFRPWFMRSAELPDLISNLNDRLNGRRWRIHAPGDLASAIHDMRRMLAETKTSALR